MNNTRNTKGFVPFNGTVDELLSHMDTVDADQVERVIVDGTDDVILSDAESIALIKSESGVSDEEAQVILNEVKRAEIDDAIARLVKLGLLELASYDSDGQPQFGLTEIGKQYASAQKKR